MIYDYFQVSGAHDTVLDYAGSFSVTLRDDNIQEFDTRWDEVLLSKSKIPSDDILESLYKLRIRESDQQKPYWNCTTWRFIRRYLSPIIKVENIGEKRKDQKLRLRNFHARHGKIESAAVVKNRKGIIGVDGGIGICYQWKEKGQCSQVYRCSFRHVTQYRAQKPEQSRHTFRASPFTR